MVFQDLALFPHMTVFENIAFGLRVKKVPDGEVRERVTGSGGGRAYRAAARQAAAPLLRRREPARRARPHHRHQPVGVPDGRAAVEPRCQAPGRYAHRAQGPAQASWRHLRLRHPRPGRGHDHGRPDRRDEQGPHRAGRHAAGNLQSPGDPVRRRLLRHADHELRGRHGRAQRQRAAFPRARASSSRCPMRCRPTSPAARSCSACAPSTCCSATAPRSRAPCSSPSRWATRRLCISTTAKPIPLVAKAGPTTPLQPGSSLSFRFAADHCHLFGADGARLY